MNTHNNQGSGIFISHGSGGHLFLNCDSHDNYDPTSSQGDGQNSDGFGVHYQAAGTGLARLSGAAGHGGTRTMVTTSSTRKFQSPLKTPGPLALGTPITVPASRGRKWQRLQDGEQQDRHQAPRPEQRCLGMQGKRFYANHSSGGNTWYNNTSFQNGTQYNMLASTWSEPNGGGTRTDGVKLTGDKAHILRNNISFPNKNEYMDTALMGSTPSSTPGI